MGCVKRGIAAAGILMCNEAMMHFQSTPGRLLSVINIATVEILAALVALYADMSVVQQYATTASQMVQRKLSQHALT